MKTAVSIPDEIFNRAEVAARKLGMSRSELYREAVEAFIEQHEQKDVTAALNELYSEDESALEPALAQLLRTIHKAQPLVSREAGRGVVGTTATAGRFRTGIQTTCTHFSANSFNRSAIKTVVAVTPTTNLRLAAPGNVFLSRTEMGLGKDSVVNVSQAVTTGQNVFGSVRRARAGGGARAGRAWRKARTRISVSLRFTLVWQVATGVTRAVL